MPIFTQFFIRLARVVRKSRKRTLLVVGLLVAASIVGNASTFYYFDGAQDSGIGFGDSLWYSVISITTIGYGDYSAQSAGARIGTVVFVVVLGLTAFTTLLGTAVDWIVDIHYKEKRGMLDIVAKGHILIVNFPSAARVRSIVQELLGDKGAGGREITLVTDQLQELPFDLDNVSFVSGSPLESETFQRANAAAASTAIVLASNYDDPASDSLVSSVVAVVEHTNPRIRTIAECLDEKHEFLFRATRCDAIIYPLRIANNLIVQETQDKGVSGLLDILTSNRRGETVFSTVLQDAEAVAGRTYLDIARRLLDEGVNLLSVVRQGEARTHFGALEALVGDSLIYVCDQRKSSAYFHRLIRDL